MFFVLDSETERWSKTNLTPKLQFINLIQCDENRVLGQWTFFTPNQVVNFLENMYVHVKKSFRVYVHNLDFDAKYLFKTLFLRYHLDLAKNQTLMGIKCQTKNKKPHYDRRGNKRWGYHTHFEFRDTLILFYHLSVKKLGEIVGLPKLEWTDYDGPITKEYTDYCFRDCDIVFKALQWLKKMFARFGLCKDIEDFNLTLPALSFELFKLKNNRFEYRDCNSRKRNLLFDTPESQNEIFRQAYFGGRTEIFNLNMMDVAYCDINSLYPYIMRNHGFPIGPYTELDPLDNADTIDEIFQNPLMFAIECDVNDAGDIPVFCERSKAGKTVFRSGPKHLLLQKEEALFMRSHITHITKYWECTQWERLFDYFDEIYAYRKELKAQSNPAEQLCKLPVNSTYGKFGQKLTQADVKCFQMSALTREEVGTYLDQGGQIYEESMIVASKKDSQFIQHNLIIASRITALARLHLYKTMQEFQNCGVRTLIYTDTDSIVIPLWEVPKIAHLMSSAMGGFKIEAEYLNFIALAPKEYLYAECIETMAGMQILEQKTKVKGCRDAEMDKYYYSHVETVRPAKFAECVKRRRDIEESLLIEKHKGTYYDKRIILPDLTTQPLPIGLDHVDNEKLVRSVVEGFFAYMYQVHLGQDPPEILQKYVGSYKKYKTYPKLHAAIETTIAKYYPSELDACQQWLDGGNADLKLEHRENIALFRDYVRGQS